MGGDYGGVRGGGEEIFVGCPVRARAWILPSWFMAVEAACANAELSPRFVFVADPDDTSTLEVIAAMAGTRLAGVHLHADGRDGSDGRVWNAQRHAHMATLRNHLLGMVREANPELFLSVDSDILLHPDAVQAMADHLDRFDAVGGKAFLGRGTRYPTFAKLTASNQIVRGDSLGSHRADVIMAVKLMQPAAYRVDYAGHHHGEDIGWALNCRAAGVKLGWTGTVTSKHVMNHDELERADSRCGY